MKEISLLKRENKTRLTFHIYNVNVKKCITSKKYKKKQVKYVAVNQSRKQSFNF